MHLNFNLENLRKKYDNIENYNNYLEAIRPLYLKRMNISITNSGVSKKDLLFEIANTEKVLNNMLESGIKDITDEKRFCDKFTFYENLISDYAYYQNDLKKNDLNKISDLKEILLKRDELYKQYMNK